MQEAEREKEGRPFRRLSSRLWRSSASICYTMLLLLLHRDIASQLYAQIYGSWCTSDGEVKDTESFLGRDIRSHHSCLTCGVQPKDLPPLGAPPVTQDPRCDKSASSSSKRIRGFLPPSVCPSTSRPPARRPATWAARQQPPCAPPHPPLAPPPTYRAVCC